MRDFENKQSHSFIADVSKIYNGETDKIDFDFEFVCDEDTGDLEFLQPVKVSGQIYEMAKGKYEAESYVCLKISVSGTYTCLCARCAKELTKTFNINADYSVTRSDSTDREDYVAAPEGLLDVGEIARSLFYLELPSKVLCSDNCRGLCPVCGCDLNSETCSCKQEKMGANKLSGLKALLDSCDDE